MTTRAEIETLILRLRNPAFNVGLDNHMTIAGNAAAEDMREAADALQQLLDEVDVGVGDIGLETTAEEREPTEAMRVGCPCADCRMRRDLKRLLSRAQGWMPIASAPKDGTKFLAASAKTGRRRVEWMESQQSDGRFWHELGNDCWSHWMPLLPPPPEEPRTWEGG